MGNWMRIISNTNSLYAVQLKNYFDEFETVSDWFETYAEAQVFAGELTAARTSAIARAAVKAANEPLGKTEEHVYPMEQ